MRIDLLEVQPRRLFAVATAALFGIWVASRPVPPPQGSRLTTAIDVASARLAALQTEHERAEARRQLSELERELDAVASSLEVSASEGDFVAGDYVRR